MNIALENENAGPEQESHTVQFDGAGCTGTCLEQTHKWRNDPPGRRYRKPSKNSLGIVD